MLISLSVAPAGGVSSITMGSFTFTPDSDFDNAGVTDAGLAWAVLATGSRDVTVTPSPALIGGNQTGEVMLNPIGPGDHGLDERETGSWNVSLVQSQPVTVTAGDVLLVTKGDATYVSGDRSGMSEEQGSLHIFSSAPPSNAILSSAIRYAGSPAIGWDVAAVDTWYTNRPAITAPAGVRTFASLWAMIGQVWNTYRFSNNINFYQALSPRNFGDTGTINNYGKEISDRVEEVAIALATDAYTEAETKQLAYRIAQWGREICEYPIFNSSNPQTDGGHYCWHMFPSALYLHLTGGTLNDAWDHAAGNYAMAFQITESIYNNDLTGGHVSSSLPAYTRQRTLGSQSGVAANTVRLPYSIASGDDNNEQVQIPINAKVIRSGSQVATVTTAKTISDDLTGTFDVAVDADPTPGFAASDVIHFEAADNTANPGEIDWSKVLYSGPTRADFSPSRGNSYRQLQDYACQIACMDLQGWLPTSAEVTKGYAIRAMTANQPSAVNDYQEVVGGSAGSTFWTDKYVGSTLVKPSQFFASDFAVSDAGGGQIQVAISALPVVGGALTDIEYRVGEGGSWTSSGTTTTGNFNVTALTTDWIYLRAVNSVGTGIHGPARRVSA